MPRISGLSSLVRVDQVDAGEVLTTAILAVVDGKVKICAKAEGHTWLAGQVAVLPPQGSISFNDETFGLQLWSGKLRIDFRPTGDDAMIEVPPAGYYYRLRIDSVDEGFRWYSEPMDHMPPGAAKQLEIA